MLQKCPECGQYRYPPGETCPYCLSSNLEWEIVNGWGNVFSWVVFHQVYHRTFADDIPYTVVLIELDQGVRMISSLIDCRMEDIRIGLPVEVVFDDITNEISLPRFRPRTV
ncbi:MAG: OB-fold domain-containing protein [Dehalococcoidales bacterium]|nr:MAG: OB-fold domain-containing protein [Dehalococcoidales bacterium]